MHNIRSYPLEENFLIHSDEQGRLYVLNATANFILESLQAGLRIPEVAGRLSREFGISLHKALHDVEAIMAEWQRIGLLPGTSPAHDEDDLRRAASPHQSRQIDVTRYYQLPGLRFSVRYDRESMERECHPRLSAIETPEAQRAEAELEVRSDNNTWIVTLNGRELSRTRSSNEARIELMIGLLASYHRELEIMAMIHAGVAAQGDKAILLPATTGGGKSTLTAALIHAGYHFLSDDTAPLDKLSSRVYPFPLGLSLRPGSWPVVAGMFPELEELPRIATLHETVKMVPVPQSKTVFRPLEVHALVFPDYEPGREDRLYSLSSTEAMVHLSGAGFWVPLRGDHIPRFVDWLQSVPCYRLEYSSISRAVDFISRLGV